MKKWLDMKWKSIVDSWSGAIWTRPYPVVFFYIHVLAFPLEDQVVGTRRRSFFNYFLFVRPCVAETSVWAKSMKSVIRFLFSFCLLSSSDSIKSATISRNGSICSWGRFNRSSFKHFSRLFFVLFNPEFMISFVHFEMRYFNVRVTISCSRTCLSY